MLAKKDDLLIMPLGGLEQIGANCTLIGHDKEWLIIDLGIAFYDKLGIEILTPDISFLHEIKNNINGILVTHAHEDHIGAIPYLWPQIQCPIYLTEFPAAILKQKFSEYSWGEDVEIKTVTPKTKIQIGKFEVEFVSLSHSILGASGIFVKTNAGSIFHTGDWKVDETPLLGDRTDEKRLRELGKEGVDCLLCDSTNILTEDDIGSESDVKLALKRVIETHKKKRITVTCFASNVARMETIFGVAKSLGRKVCIIGRSMHKMINAVSETSYYTANFKNNISSIITDEEASSMPASKVLLICTGSQGEARSALYRLARGENRVLKLGQEDVVLFSSKVIPGNEIGIRDMQNLLAKKGVELVTTDSEYDIHVSGHPNKAAIAQMYSWLNPRAFIPVHGEPRMLLEHEKFAKINGILETLIAESGDIIRLKDQKLEKIANRSLTFNAIDGNDLIPLNSINIKERGALSYNGYVSISFILGDNYKIKGTTDIDIRGIYIEEESKKKLDSQIYQVISNIITKYTTDIEKIKSESASSVRKIFLRHFEKKPLITMHIH